MDFKTFLSIYDFKNEKDFALTAPRSYEDYSIDKEGIIYQDEQRFIIKAYFESATRVKKSGKFELYHIVAKLEKSGMKLTFNLVNQSFYLRILKKNKLYVFIGIKKSKPSMMLLNKVTSIDNVFIVNGIKPKYLIKKGVSEKDYTIFLLRVIKNDNVNNYEFLPSFLIKKYQFLPYKESLENLHFPNKNNKFKFDLSLFRFTYENALVYCLSTLLLKHNRSKIKITRKVLELDSLQKVFKEIHDNKFVLTEDQSNAITDIFESFNKPYPMHRLLQGDVGTGKTLVCIGAMYLNYLRNGQSLLMAPTKSLAMQHYKTIKSFFSNSNISVAIYESTMRVKEKREILSKLESGEINILIGTTNLLNDNLNFKNLTFAAIDEEQRFGVKQRNKIMNKNDSIDMLLMSATPIPRTYAKMLNSDLEISFLKTFPKGQRKINTYLLNQKKFTTENLVSLINDSNRKGIIVFPRIEDNENVMSVEKMRSIISEEYPQALSKIGFITGKTKLNEQQETLQKLRDNEYKFVLATSVVEVGIDIQDLNTIIVFEANYFGLSSLHQLRGRVGRNGKESECFLLTNNEDPNSVKPLFILRNTLDGQEIAKYDLEKRGFGSLSGIEQTGQSPFGVCDFLKNHQVFSLAYQDSVKIIDQYDTSKSCKAFVDKIYNNFINNDTDI